LRMRAAKHQNASASSLKSTRKGTARSDMLQGEQRVHAVSGSQATCDPCPACPLATHPCATCPTCPPPLPHLPLATHPCCPSTTAQSMGKAQPRLPMTAWIQNSAHSALPHPWQ
jgi:hypothetical protein